MVNYLSGFQSLIEVAIALNIAFIALKTISVQLEELFIITVDKKIDDALNKLATFEDITNLKITEHKIPKITKKGIEEKVKNLLEKMSILSTNFNKDKSSRFSAIIYKAKQFYVISAIYSLCLLFFSGHLDCEVGNAYTSLFLLLLGVLLFSIYIFFTKIKFTLFKTVSYIIIYFLLILIAPYVISMLLSEYTSVFDQINTFFALHNKLISYVSLLLLFQSVIISLIIFQKEKILIKKEFNEDIDNILEEKNLIEKDIDEFISLDKINEGIKEDKDKLLGRLNARIDSEVTDQ